MSQKRGPWWEQPRRMLLGSRVYGRYRGELLHRERVRFLTIFAVRRALCERGNPLSLSPTSLYINRTVSLPLAFSPPPSLNTLTASSRQVVPWMCTINRHHKT